MNIPFSRHNLDLDVEDPEPDTDSEEDEDDDELLIDLDQFDSNEELLIDENKPLHTRKTRNDDTEDYDTLGRKQIQVLADVNHIDQ